MKSPDPDRLGLFYASAFGLQVSATGEGIEAQSKGSRLVFERAAAPVVPYHFAFNISERKIEGAADWIRSRAVTLREPGSEIDIFHSDSWDADSIYFSDPDGNIVELIARHSIPNPETSTFDVCDIGDVSEIGVPEDRAGDLRRRLISEAGLPAYGESSREFLPLGDEHGLLIVVNEDRAWFPERRSPARRQALRVEAEHAGRAMFIADDGHEYELRF
ncbi:MAG: hypothetical protein ABIV92_16400 [Thermoflexales bacterium]